MYTLTTHLRGIRSILGILGFALVYRVCSNLWTLYSVLLNSAQLDSSVTATASLAVLRTLRPSKLSGYFGAVGALTALEVLDPAQFGSLDLGGLGVPCGETHGSMAV